MSGVSKQGERAVAIARAWIGTPFVHRASLRGVGCDCLGLVRGVWRELFGAEAEMPPAYAPLWAESGEGALLEAALRRHMPCMAVGEAEPGDVLLFRFRARDPARHVAVLSAVDRMIHAYADRGVMETAFGGWWRRRVVGVFRFPLAPPPSLACGERPLTPASRVVPPR